MIKGVLVAFLGQKQGFQSQFNEIPEMTHTYSVLNYQTKILLLIKISKAPDWPTNQKPPLQNFDIFTSKPYSSLSLGKRDSFYLPDRTSAIPCGPFYRKQYHPTLEFLKNYFCSYFKALRRKTTPLWIFETEI